MKKIPFHVILISIFWLTGCGLASSQINDSNPTVSQPPLRTGTTPFQKPPVSSAVSNTSANSPGTPEPVYQTDISSPNVIDPNSQKLLEMARNDLAQRLKIPQDAIQLIQIEQVSWPDAGLGCPDPKVFYIQILSPGYRIILAVGNQQYRYHTDLEETLILCDKEAEVLPLIPITPGEIKDGKPWIPVN